MVRLAPPPGPARPLTVAVIVQTVGFGLLVTLGAIYFVRIMEFEVAGVAVAFTVAAGGGVLAGITAGYLSDRIGPTALTAALLAVTSLTVIGHLFVSDPMSLFIVLTAYQFADRGAAAVRGTLIARSVPPSEQVTTRSYLRAVSNIGFAIGAGLGSLALVGDTKSTFAWLICVAGAAYGSAAVVVAVCVSRVEPIPSTQRARLTGALRDKRFLAFAMVNASLSLQFAVLEFGMPIWVTQHTVAPEWMVTVLFVVNTALVTALQVRMGRSSTTLPGAIRTTTIAGILLGVSCALIGLAGYVPIWFAVTLLASAGVVHAFGEMAQGASSWSLAYELAPSNAHGQYQGLFATSTSVGLVAGSSVVAFVALSWELVGWLVLGGMFVLAGLALPIALRSSPHRT